MPSPQDLLVILAVIAAATYLAARTWRWAAGGRAGSCTACGHSCGSRDAPSGVRPGGSFIPSEQITQISAAPAGGERGVSADGR